MAKENVLIYIKILFLKDNSALKGEKELIRLSINNGSFYVGSCLENKTKAGGTLEEEWDSVDNSVWLVVKSYKANAVNKTVDSVILANGFRGLE